MKFISEDFKTKLEEKIKDYESKTCLEFVPAIVSSSSSYTWPRLFFAMLLASALFLSSQKLHPMSWHLWLPLFVGLFIAFFALISWEPLTKILLPKSLFEHEVQKKALEIFALEEVFATKKRSGVLIFVSLLEKSVFVLADKGFDAHVSKDEWKQMGIKLAKDFDSQNPGASFFEALDLLNEKMGAHFPPNEDGNELPDHLRER